uniref:Bm8553 n=1 Tax=Brugia malayi TaxID=6279 RepID=A0A0H5S183_BRUMA|nr:Bm8553 [Brugia malayi]
MNKGGLEEANRILNLALEELNFIVDGAEQKGGIEIAETIFETKRQMNNNDNSAPEKANVAVGDVQALNWNSSVNNWMDYENDDHRDSGTSSSDGMPTSDAPTSSTTSTNISIFDTLLQVIELG